MLRLQIDPVTRPPEIILTLNFLSSDTQDGRKDHLYEHLKVHALQKRTREHARQKVTFQFARKDKEHHLYIITIVPASKCFFTGSTQ